MDFSKKRAGLSIEPLEARDVPAHLGLVVALPYPASPAAEVALTAPHDLGQGEEASASSDTVEALKVQFQDIHFTQTVSKASPKLFSSSDAASALTVQSQDIQLMKIKFADLLG